MQIHDNISYLSPVKINRSGLNLEKILDDCFIILLITWFTCFWAIAFQIIVNQNHPY